MVVSVAKLTLEDARRMVDAAGRQARTDGCAMTIAVVDAGAHLILFERQDGSHIGSVEIAQQKARTAVFFGMPTATMEKASKAAPALASLPNVLPFAGGLPIMNDGQIIGAIAASGGMAEQDVACAQAGLDALNPG